MSQTLDIRSIIRRLQQGKDVPMQLAAYTGVMSDTAARLSAVRFAMNVMAFRETLYTCKDDPVLCPVPERIMDFSDQLVALTDQWLDLVTNGADKADASALCKEIDALREACTDYMRQITYLTDHFTIYEYVLNRYEYQFKDGKLAEGYSDQEFTKKLLQYIVGRDADSNDGNHMQMLRTKSVIEQLPLRMTKNKFYQVLRDGLSVYTTANRSAFDNILEMIRTSAMISDITELKDQFGSIADLIQRVKEEGLVVTSEEEYDAWMIELQDDLEVLNSAIGLLMSVQELVNDLYVMADTISVSGVPCGDRYEQSLSIIKAVQAAFEDYDLDEVTAVYEMYEAIEGVQEELYEQLTIAESVFEEFMEVYADAIKTNYEAEFAVLCRVTKLISDSLFAPLDTEGEDEICNQAMIESAYTKLIVELDEQFMQMDKQMRRAVMAKVIALLPPFIRKYDQLEQYLLTALEGCENMAEKIACVEILEGMMADA